MKNKYDNDSILELFTNLTPEQLQQFRAKIYPTLKAVRAEIVGSTQPGEGSAAAQEVTAILLEQEAVTS